MRGRPIDLLAKMISQVPVPGYNRGQTRFYPGSHSVRLLGRALPECRMYRAGYRGARKRNQMQ
jgi:hypothetical protein